MAIRPIALNPGGVVDPDDLIGRDRELNRLLRSVTTGGAKLLGDRRMGKTSLLHKLAQRLDEVGHAVIRISAESSDPQKFSRDLVAELRRNRVLRDHVSRWEAELGGELKVEVGVGGVRLAGRVARSALDVEQDLFRACADACQRIAPYRLVFIFDEITVLARRLGELVPGGPEEFLRSLRVPRQQLPGVSMMLAGSVGLHHVIRDRSPVNDLDGVDVGPLNQPDAVYLTRCLLRGAQLARQNEQAIAESIAEQTCGIPYYIHKLVGELADRGLIALDQRTITTAVDDALHTDRWETEHYRDRLLSYYGQDAELAGMILNEYAAAADPLSIDEMMSGIGAVPQRTGLARNAVVRLVDRLEDDHYLVRVGDADRFATTLLRRAWLAKKR